eukprot:4663475-Amphidinium_carterae.1
MTFAAYKSTIRRTAELEAGLCTVLYSLNMWLAMQDMQKRRWTECAVACQRHWRGVLGRRKAHH